MRGIPTKQCLMKTRVPAASNHSLGTESKHINLYGPVLIQDDLSLHYKRKILQLISQLLRMSFTFLWKTVGIDFINNIYGER